MTSPATELYALTAALDATTDGPLMTRGDFGHSLFVGSGDSLAACLLAETAGQRAVSAGDVAWAESIPAAFDTVIGVSHSGQTTATIAALSLARDAGLRTIAITADGTAPLANTADDVIVVPQLHVSETVPAGSYIMLAFAVLNLLGYNHAGGPRRLATNLRDIADRLDPFVETFGDSQPHALSILTLPDMRSAGDFWSLKLIEATGLAARSVPLEESGHVDYFIGPHRHLTVQLIGATGGARHARLGQALADNGQTVTFLDATEAFAEENPWQRQLAVAAVGAYVAHRISRQWGTAPFRNGEVPMDAAHIQITA